MIKITLFSLVLVFSVHCAEKAFKCIDVPGSLVPTTHTNCSPMGELKLALKDSSIHGSGPDDLLRSLSKSAKEHFYEAQIAHSEIKKQHEFINKKFNLTKEQIQYLKDTKKKLKPEEKEKLAQLEIDLLVHHLDACALHMALMIVQGTSVFKP